MCSEIIDIQSFKRSQDYLDKVYNKEFKCELEFEDDPDAIMKALESENERLRLLMNFLYDELFKLREVSDNITKSRIDDIIKRSEVE